MVKIKGYTILVLIISLLIVSCSKTRQSEKILYFSLNNQDKFSKELKNTGNSSNWEVIVTGNEQYLSDDSLSQISAIILSYSSLNGLGHRSIPALKRYMEAGGGGIVIHSDTLLNQKGWPWLQSWDEEEEGSEWTMDQGRLVKLEENYSHEDLEKGLSYAIGRNNPPDYSKAATLNVPDSSRYTRTVLAQGLDEPLEMALLPDNDVLFIERKGGVKIYDDETKELKTIANFEVFSGIEDGLLGVTADPGFSANNWLYFYYSVAGDREVNRLSRFELIGDSLAQASEKILLEIPTQRIYCCHSAGYLAFDAQGHLYLSTGDNTNAEDPLVEGYPPVDERPGHELADDQATAANTDNLKGKILRIIPQDDGTYAIPEGNLFPKDGSRGRPEIYIMGSRNPFRFTVDKKKNIVYWGDVGPDTKVKSENGEFMSYDEINQANNPGFYGWPYFLGNNQAFPHYDYATKQEGPKKDPAKPVNDSPNNTGERILPPAQGAMIWYGKGNSGDFPLVGNGGASAMVGPVYYSDLYSNAPFKLSDYYHGKLIIYEWIRGWMMAVTLDENGNFLRMEPFLDHLEFAAPVDVQINQDGAVYVLEYGTNWFSKNTDAQLVRIEFKEGNRNPVAEISMDKQYGSTPLTVQLSARKSLDHDGNDKLQYHWSIEGKKLEGETVEYTFTHHGVHKVELTVTDDNGGIGTATSQIYAGNTPPEIQIKTSANRSFYWDNSMLDYRIEVKDEEDLEINPDNLNISFGYVPRGKDVAVILSGDQITVDLQFIKGQQMIASMDCKACHAMDQISVGPSYLAISQRYAGEKEAVKKLSAKIIEGGSGVWGAHFMSPHPELSTEDAGEMVDYILSLAHKGETGKLPLKDTIVLKEHIGQGIEGSYLLNASYTDNGANGIEPLESRAHITLNNPYVQAEDFDKGNVGIGTNTTNEFYAYVRAAHKGHMEFEQIDLKWVKKLRFRIQPIAEGKIEVRLDEINGSVISSVSIPANPEGTGAWKEITAPLKETKGIHDLYFVFINPEGKEEHLFNIDWIYFSDKN
jgi:cytochrome c